MEIVLAENDYKEGWRLSTIDYLFNCLLFEVAELHTAIYNDEITKAYNISKECIDIANFAMMIRDIRR